MTTECCSGLPLFLPTRHSILPATDSRQISTHSHITRFLFQEKSHFCLNLYITGRATCHGLNKAMKQLHGNVVARFDPVIINGQDNKTIGRGH